MPLLSTENAEDHFEFADNKPKRQQKTTYKPCIGKAYGYTCQNCNVRSYCDGIPEINQTKK